MRWLPWLLAVLLACALAVTLTGREPEGVTVVRRDTLVVRDTVRDTVPEPLLVRTVRWDTLRVPVPLLRTDTVLDTVFIPIPISSKVYRTEDYRAVVSGYRPSLDSMEVYRRCMVVRETVTRTPPPKRWGVGVQAGVGYPHGWHVGVGVSYDLWQW